MTRGIIVALVSGFAFAMSGPFGKPLLAAGWSPAGIVLVRLWIAALVTAIPLLLFARDRFYTLKNAPLTVLAYGLTAVVLVQFGYFNAIAHMSVTIAILVEFSAPLLVLAYLWARRGRRPSPQTAAGATLAVAGLVVVVMASSSGADMNLTGLAWAITSMVGLAAYFLLAEDGTDDPGESDASAPGAGVDQFALVVGGLVVGAIALTLTSAVGLTPVRISTDDVDFGSFGVVPWWLPAVGIGAVATGLAYIAGILAINLIGPTLAAFLGFSEVIGAAVVAWIMLDESLTIVQCVGAVAIMGGVIAIKYGEQLRTDPIDSTKLVHTASPSLP